MPGGLRLIIPVDARGGSAGGKVTLGVRPEHVLMSKSGEAFVGTVVALEHLGSESSSHAKLTSAGMITWRVFGAIDVAVGDVVRLWADATNCHLFDAEGNAFPPVHDLSESAHVNRQTVA